MFDPGLYGGVVQVDGHQALQLSGPLHGRQLVHCWGNMHFLLQYLLPVELEEPLRVPGVTGNIEELLRGGSIFLLNLVSPVLPL